MKSIEERLQVLEDKEAIRGLLLEYGRSLDSRDTKAYSELFAENGEWSGGIGSAKTPAGIKKMLDDLFGNSTGSFLKPHHVMANMAIEVEGDTATANSRWIWMLGDKEGSPVVMRAGTYEDSLVRENGEWKILKRLATTELANPSL